MREAAQTAAHWCSFAVIVTLQPAGWQTMVPPMGPENKADRLKVLQAQMAWLLNQAEENESGRAQAAAENAIYADHMAAELAGKYRRRAGDLAIMIAAHEEVDA
jgi:hypothetical protein